MSRLIKAVTAVTLIALLMSVTVVIADTQALCTLATDQGWLGYITDSPETVNAYVSDGVCILTIDTHEVTGAFAGVPYDSVTWSVDKKLAWVSGHEGNQEVYVWDGETVTNVSNTPLDEHHPVWSVDGPLAWGVGQDNDSAIYVWDGIDTLELTPGLSEYASPNWSMDGRLAWMSNVDESLEIQLWDGEKVVNLSQHEGYDLHPVWSMDGRLAWTSERAGHDEIYVWDGETSVNISAEIGGNRNFIWSADGRIAWIIAPIKWDSTEGSKIYVWDGETVTLIGSYLSAGRLAWLDDGRLSWIMGHDTVGTAYVWDGDEVISIADDASFTFGWSSNGWLAWQAGSMATFTWDIHVWNGVEDHIIDNASGDILGWRWSPDGRLAWIARSEEMQLYLWDGTKTEVLTELEGFPTDLVWSPAVAGK